MAKLSRRDLFKAGFGSAAAAMVASSAWPLRHVAAEAECVQEWPFITRTGFMDVGVPVDPDGDPGSGSFGSAPYGPTNELGIIFDTQASFSMSVASIALGVTGNARNTLTAFEVEPGSVTRTLQLGTATADSPGVEPFNLNERIYGVRNPPVDPHFWTWRWFDVRLVVKFAAGKRYELVFSDFTITNGQPNEPNNWIYGHPLYDNENRAYGQPYDVCGLLRVVDGSVRGTRATLLPMMLLARRRTSRRTSIPR